MTLYYSLVFFLLVLEMSIFLLLVFPLPFTWRKKTFEFISNSPLIAKLQYGMKITFIFILILFVDSVNRVYRVQRELSEHANAGPYGQAGGDRMEVQARKFYSQRNMFVFSRNAPHVFFRCLLFISPGTFVASLSSSP